MSFKDNQREYKTPREKNALAWRNYKLTFFFILMALVVLVIKNRYEYWSYIQTYFY